jgi:D-ribulokinase
MPLADKYSPLFIGIDIGSESVRAGLFNTKGELINISQQKISIWRDSGGIVEQSSDEIWMAICSTIRQITNKENG